MVVISVRVSSAMIIQYIEFGQISQNSSIFIRFTE